MKRINIQNINLSATESSLDTLYKHEGHIAGTPPFLRGVPAFLNQKDICLSAPPSYKTTTLNSIDQLETFISNNKLSPIIVEIKIAATPSISIILNHHKYFLESKISIKTLITYFSKNNIQPTINLITKTNTVVPEEKLISRTLAVSKEVIDSSIQKGNTIESITSKINFSWPVSKNYFFEICKQRATRVLWSKIVHGYLPKNESAMAIQSQSFVDKSFFKSLNSNPIQISNTLFSIIYGGTTKIICDTTPEVINTLSEFLEEQLFSLHTIDPWGGSKKVEKLTEEIYSDIWKELTSTTQSIFS